MFRSSSNRSFSGSQRVLLDSSSKVFVPQQEDTRVDGLASPSPLSDLSTERCLAIALDSCPCFTSFPLAFCSNEVVIVVEVEVEVEVEAEISSRCSSPNDQARLRPTRSLLDPSSFFRPRTSS